MLLWFALVLLLGSINLSSKVARCSGVNATAAAIAVVGVLVLAEEEKDDDEVAVMNNCRPR